MAYILNTTNNKRFALRSHHLFGRSSEKVDTLLGGSVVSRLHAALEWNGEGWHIRDISRNGTWLSNARLPANESASIAVGDELSFGNVEGPRWRLIDDSEPVSLLVGESSDSTTQALEGYVFLPDEEEPELSISYSTAQASWVQSFLTCKDGEQREAPLNHGDIVSCGDKHWRLFLAHAAEDTQVYPVAETPLTDFEFIFSLSLDEEITKLTLECRQLVLDLGDRAHHYLLLHLARLRAQQAHQGFDSESQGWVKNSVLVKELGCDQPHLNILLHRAKKQICNRVEHHIDADGLVERAQGRMRFGCDKFRIYKGAELVYQMNSSQQVASQYQ